MKEEKRKRGRGGWLLLLLLLILGGTLLLRLHASAPPSGKPDAQANANELSAPEVTQPPAASPEPTRSPEASILPEPPETSAPPSAVSAAEPTPNPEVIHPIRYNKQSFQLVTDMVYAYQHQTADHLAVIESDVTQLKAIDPELGAAWEEIMRTWVEVNGDLEINYERLPDDLPQDDSLAILVLGFQLEPDGSMAPELKGRCDLALKAAEQYPNAFVIVTGGGTAMKNPDVTEAGVMEAYLLEQGIAPERIIREAASRTTEENAQRCLAILTREYPQVRQLALVTSDYHIPLGTLLFTEVAQLYGCEHGAVPFRVTANLGFPAEGLPDYTDPKRQELYVWAVADPQITS